MMQRRLQTETGQVLRIDTDTDECFLAEGRVERPSYYRHQVGNEVFFYAFRHAYKAYNAFNHAWLALVSPAVMRRIAREYVEDHAPSQETIMRLEALALLD